MSDISDVDVEKLPRFLEGQRWYGGKGWPIKSVAVIDRAELPHRSGTAVLTVVEVHYALGSAERYLLAVTPHADGDVAEALQDDAFSRALLRLIAEGRGLNSAAGVLRGERLPGAAALLDALPAAPDVLHLGAEQSNTSIVFGQQVILKVIRRLEGGHSPEYEVGRFLAEQGFRGVPPLLGALQLEGPAATTVAVLHRFVPGATDGWKWALEVFRAPSLPTGARDEIEQLGARVGELHVVLASHPDDPAFSPEPLQREDLQRWSASIVGELGVTLADASDRFPTLFEHREKLVERAQRLAHRNPEGKKIRIHGDLHLGQTLRGPEGWLIFDFEGEPARKLSQRREKHSPLKDVAGILRSFVYAAAVLRREGRPAEAHAAEARAAFLTGYRKVVAGTGVLPSNPDDFLGMLEAFELEKLLYEVRYELHNRPDWAAIPIAALLQAEAKDIL